MADRPENHDGTAAAMRGTTNDAKEGDGLVVAALYRYPVKGFSPEPMDRAALPRGGTMPHDRQFAIENGPSGFDSDAPAHLPKVKFLELMRNPALAAYRTGFDPSTGIFTVRRDGIIQISGNLHDEAGRTAIENWASAAFSAELQGPPKIRFADGHSFSDVPDKRLHLLNLASLRDLETRLGEPLDPARFRANIHIAGAPAYAELDWVGRTLRLPGIDLRAEARTSRCNATNVDPATGQVDRRLPRSLLGNFGHSDFGIYLSAATGGEIGVGDRVTITRR